jgi:diguanylate cyclase (GGDEF)-like protein
VLNPLGALHAAIGRVAAGDTARVQLPEAVSGEMREVMEHFARMAHHVSVSRLELEEKVRERTAALDQMTKVDALTGALNRRGMNDQLELALMRARRERQGLGILWLDVDLFKQINDAHGHAAGDAALRAIAQLMRLHIRPYDHAARWGGDEFLLLLSPIDAAQLDAIAERICTVVRNHGDVAGQRLEGLSVSIGGYLLSEDDSLDRLLEHADRALYAAKAAGRNCYHRSCSVQESHA